MSLSHSAWLLAKGQGIVTHMVVAPCVPSAFPFLGEDKAAGVTFSLGSHTLNEIIFPGAHPSAVFLPLAAFK